MLHHLKKPIKPCWYIIALLVIVLAVMVQSARWLSPQISRFHESIETLLSKQLNAQVSIGQIDASWPGLLPEVSLHDLQVTSLDNEPLVSIGRGHLKLDVLASLYRRLLVWRDIEASEVNLRIQQSATGGWGITGLTANKITDSQWQYQSPGGVFLLARKVNMADTHVTLVFHNQRRFSAVIPELVIENAGHFHRLEAKAEVEGRDAFRFILEGVGNPAEADSFFAKAYLTLDDFPLEQLVQVWSGIGEKATPALAVTDKGIDGKLWFDFAGPSRFYMNGHVDWRVDSSSDFAKQYYLDIPFSATIAGEYSIATGLAVNLGDIQVDQALNIESLGLLLHDDVLRIALPQLDLGQWHQWTQARIHHGQPIHDVIDALSPRGELNNIVLELDLEQPLRSALTANVRDVTTNAWNNVPAFSGVDGYLHSAVDSGYVLLDTDELSLWPRSIYEQPIEATRASGAVSWTLSIEKQTIAISGHNLVLSGAFGDAKGNFQLHTLWHPKAGDTQLNLQVGLQQAPATAHRQLLPTVLPQSLRQWLEQAVQAGDVEQAGFIYRGAFNNPLHRSLQLFADIDSADINFSNDWPPLRKVAGDLLVDNDTLHSHIDQGTVYGAERVQGTVSWSRRENAVSVDGAVAASIPSLLRYSQESWLRTLVNDIPDNWQGRGNANLEVSLLVPLDGSAQARQVVVATMKDVDLTLIPAELDMSGINGKLGYESGRGFFSSDLQGMLLGGEFTGDISGGLEQGPVFAISGRGRASVELISSWLKQTALLKHAQGMTDYTAEFVVPRGENPVSTLDVFSDLQGVTLSYPEPFNKTAQLPVPLAVTATFSEAVNDYKVALGKRLSFHSRDYGNNWRATHIGLSDAELPDFIDPPVAGTKILGRFNQLNVEPWVDVYREYIQAQEASSAGAMEVFLLVGDLSYNDYHFSNWLLSGQREQQGWSFVIDSDDMLGGVYMDDDTTTPWVVELDYLQWPPGSVVSTGVPEQSLTSNDSFWSDLNPGDIPPVDVAINRLVYDGKPFGKWSFALRPNAQEIAIENIHGNLAGLSVRGQNPELGARVSWRKATASQPEAVTVSGIIKGSINGVVDQWQLPAFLQSDEALIDISLGWEGTPGDYSAEALSGELEFDLKDGTFTQDKLEGAADKLQLLSLINFDTWLRWVRLDFSNMSSKGIAFDQFDGALSIAEGRIDFSKPIQMEGPTAKMQLTGYVDYPLSTVDATLTATVPVGGNLTTVAALTAGLPVAASVYLVSKLLGRQFDKASSVTYQIEGNLADPQVVVEKVDNGPLEAETADSDFIDQP